MKSNSLQIWEDECDLRLILPAAGGILLLRRQSDSGACEQYRLIYSGILLNICISHLFVNNS